LALFGFVFLPSKSCFSATIYYFQRAYVNLGQAQIGFVFSNSLTQYAERITQNEKIGFVLHFLPVDFVNLF